jgi:hypothetical protein
MRGNAPKSKKLLFEGRSILLNALFIAIHVLGVSLIFNAFLVDPNSHFILKLLGFGMFLGATVMLLILKGFYMYAYFARLVLAVVFLISGFSKLNDPIGFAQILEQYFQDGALSLKIAQTLDWPDFSLLAYTAWALKISISLAIIEILLALMLLYHMLYKLAVFILLPLMLMFSYVTFYTSTCDEQQTFERHFQVQKSDNLAQDLQSRSLSDQTLTLLAEKNEVLYFAETQHHLCVANCGCLGASDNTLFGFELTKELAFSRNLMLLLFTLILFITQFWLLPNAAFESTLFGFCAWVAILVQGIITGWFWLVILSALVLYLATNVRRFGLRVLKTSVGALTFVALVLAGIVYYVISFEPLSDFRAYAVGSSLVNPIDENADETTLVYVYQHKFTNKMVFLSEESRIDSPIVGDSNYVFVREKEHKANPFNSPSSYKFRPSTSVEDIQNKTIEHPLVLPFLEKYSEELYRVFNKKNGLETVVYSNEFSKELYKDTNLVIEKYVGVHHDYAAFDLGPSLVSSELIFVWVVKDIRKISEENWGQIRALTQKINERQYENVAIGYQRASFWYENSEMDYSVMLYLNMDELELKQICRSNVCLMVLQKGVITAKYPLRGLPRFETISSKLRLE